MIVQKIAAETGLSTSYIDLLVRTASHRYKTYPIPKKSGGDRIISQPARELKLLQYWLIDRVLQVLPVHPAAFAYRKGRGIFSHALVHSRHNFLLRVDFRNFFESITGADVEQVLEHNAVSLPELIRPQDRRVVRALVCKGDRLTIGAPSSPVVSNAVMFQFDTEWSERCTELGVAYSRYADDIYVSTNSPNVLARILENLRSDLATRPFPRLTINEAKTTFTSRKRRRLVTGLVLTPECHVSLGRRRKRRIKSLVFQYCLGQLGDTEVNYLRGFIAYVRSVEPLFVERLLRKYGSRVRGLM